jgi:hypothetical protein
MCRMDKGRSVVENSRAARTIGRTPGVRELYDNIRITYDICITRRKHNESRIQDNPTKFLALTNEQPKQCNVNNVSIS